MSTCSHFHVMKDAIFSKELLNDIEREIKNNQKLVSDYVLLDDVVFINFTHSGFETLFVTTDYEKTFFKLKFPDDSLYSGFKFRYGEHNIFAFKIMLLLKYHLKESIIISSEYMDEYFSSDFITALKYVNEELGYNISAEVRENHTSPRIFINNEEVINIYDEDNKIFNSMFKIVNLNNAN